ncbi:hypothetical protein B0H13DRAFT_1872526 [Mycena leptocephala]|nr:hypothetical protein B0H13DRAFT_1872526 [Mycena leptocephala]
MDEVVERQPTPPLAPSNATTNSIPDAATAAASSTGQDEAGMKTLYDALEAQSQLLRQSFVAQNQEGKKTGGTYERHYKNFIAWWDDHEAQLLQRDPSYTAIPALPLTVAKITLFLHHEMTRPQKRKLADGRLRPQ